MGNNSFFGDTNLSFKVFKDALTENQIHSVIPFDFKGKKDFVKFYLTHNGVFFPDGAEMKRDIFYEVNEHDFNRLEVEFFYDIEEHMIRMWEATKKHSPKARAFADTHIPFARDAAGNDFWIEIPTGLIKYISWEYGISEGKTIAAPSFKDFCLALKVLDY